MAVNLKEMSRQPEGLGSGHRLCAGCAASIIVRQILHAAGGPVVAVNATCCLEVTTSVYPTTAWNVPWMHNAFENASATASGIEAAYRALKKEGAIAEEIKIVVFGGDGGTFDIGLQSLSGALERGHDFVYVCYDNEAYMNTGIQRSSATPRGASTMTSPVGKAAVGKKQSRKNMTEVVAAHRVPYVAQASPSHWRDLMVKAQKAFAVEGPAFLNVISPCVPGWRYESEETIKLARLAVETCYWPLYEVEDGRRYRVTFKPREKKPLAEWLGKQGRFQHLLRPENAAQLAAMQAEVDEEWEALLRRSEG